MAHMVLKIDFHAPLSVILSAKVKRQHTNDIDDRYISHQIDPVVLLLTYIM